MELCEKLMNGSVSDFGKEASERNEIIGGLVEGVGEMSWVCIGDKVCFVGKGKGVHVSVRETIEGGVVHPCLGGSRDGMMEVGLEAGRLASWGLKGGIWCGRRAVVGKGELSTEECREGRSNV